MISLVKKYLAFSVAEAMVALAIGSVVLGMSAPLISKQVQKENFNDAQYQLIQKQLNETINRRLVPANAIMFFEGGCPTGWTDMSSSYGGRYVRVDGSYDICDVQGEDESGACKKTVSTQTITAGTKQGETLRRITGSFPGQDADIEGNTGVWGDTNLNKSYVDQLKRIHALGGAFDYLTSAEAKTEGSPFQLPKDWNKMKWPGSSSYYTYDASTTYLKYMDPAILTVDVTRNGGTWWDYYVNIFDTKMVAPTNTTADETKPKTIVLKACKSPAN